MRKGLRDIKKLIEPLGWWVDGQDGSNHYRLCNSEGNRYTTSFSASDRRTLKNLEASLKRINRGCAA